LVWESDSKSKDYLHKKTKKIRISAIFGVDYYAKKSLQVFETCKDSVVGVF